MKMCGDKIGLWRVRQGMRGGGEGGHLVYYCEAETKEERQKRYPEAEFHREEQEEKYCY
jgi:hypothetical protein